jgi:lysophospholipase L1-like esterase
VSGCVPKGADPEDNGDSRPGHAASFPSSIPRLQAPLAMTRTHRAVPQTPLLFAALGDSYTIGEGVPPGERWPVQLARRLRDEGMGVDDPLIVARTGWTAEELEEGIREAEADGRIAPGSVPFHLVSLLVGVNDQYRGGEAEAFRECLRRLLGTAVRLAGGRAGRVVVLSIPDWGVTPFAADRDRGAIAAAIDRFNAVSREEVLREGARWVDVTLLTRGVGADAGWLAEDGLHPSGRMYARWAEEVLGVARRILAEGRKEHR